MNSSQASQLSFSISAMQSTIVSVLRDLAAEPAASEGERLLYARWYCKRAIAQELRARTRSSTAETMSTPHAPAPEAPDIVAVSVVADTTPSWSDQVQAYLQRRRDGGVTLSGLPA